MGRFSERVHRLVWSSRRRKIRKLRAFARTESDGGLDIARIAERTKDPALRESLLSHARDEMLHARLFRNRAAELELEEGGPRGERAGGERPLFVGDLDDVEYVAFLRASEGKGAGYFRSLSRALEEDPRTRGVVERILVDEERHERYTEDLLAAWRREGRGRELRRALRRMRRTRIGLALARFSRIFSATIGQGMLVLLYFTLLVPFAAIARSSLRRRAPLRPSPAEDLVAARRQWA